MHPIVTRMIENHLGKQKVPLERAEEHITQRIGHYVFFYSVQVNSKIDKEKKQKILDF